MALGSDRGLPVFTERIPVESQHPPSDAVSAEQRDRHATFVRSAQAPDGGFTDRHGGADLYYTGFALRSLAVLDALTPAICERTDDDKTLVLATRLPLL